MSAVPALVPCPTSTLPAPLAITGPASPHAVPTAPPDLPRREAIDDEHGDLERRPRRPVIPPARSAVASRSLAHRLNVEWATIVADPRSEALLRGWPAGSPADQYPTPALLLAACGREGGLPDELADTVLAGVVAVARTDALAARLVLQRLVPGLIITAARRTRSRPSDRQALFNDLVATAWVRIRTYPLERRPTKIAANLLRDTEYDTCVRPTRLRSASEEPVAQPWQLERRPSASDHLDHPRPHASDEVAAVFADARNAGVDPNELELVRALYLERRRAGDLAREHKVTLRTIYNRRKAILYRIAAAAA